MMADINLRETLKNQYLESKNSESFVDKIFKPEFESIFNGKTDISKKLVPEFYNNVNKIKGNEVKDILSFEWKRLSNFTNLTNIFKDRKQDLLNDIKYDDISIPHFASTLEYLLRNKERVFRLFNNSKIAPNGVINLNVFIHGEMVEICIDDYFVSSVNKNSNDSKVNNAFIKINPTTNNLWALILEKAYAKLSGSYENCLNGDFISTVQLFSPAPIENIKHSNIKNLLQGFENIKNALHNNYDVYCDIKLPKEVKEYEKLIKLGLITTHAYSVIDYYELTDKLNNKTPLLKIKNLWGVNEWEGDWSDNSTKWNDELRKLLNHENKQDGIFWIAYSDYVNFYTNTYIIYESDFMNYTSEKLNFDKTKALNLVKIKVSKDTKKANIVVNQKSKYLYRVNKSIENFENNYCSLIVYKNNGDNEIECLGSDSGKKDRLLVELNDISKGDYFVAINLPFKQSHYINKNLGNLSNSSYNPTLIISVLSDAKTIEIQDIPENKEDIVEFYNNYVSFDSNNRSENKYTFDEEGEPDSYRICHLDKKSAYGYIYYQNNSNASINEILTFTELSNISIIPLLKDGNLNELSEEIMLSEDPNLANQLNLLKGQTSLESKFEILKDCNMDVPISKKNEFKVMITIAPNTYGTILFEKLDEVSKINFESDISLTYPLEIILVKDEKFNISKSKINYQGKQVDVYESIIEHNSGVVIRYRNRSKNLVFGSFLKFSDIKNLRIRLTSDYFIDENMRDNLFDYEITNKDSECYVCLKPDEFKYISLEAINIFEPFSYNLKCTYMINKSNLKDL